MARPILVRLGVLLASVLILTVAVETVSADGWRTWFWFNDTLVLSVASGDADLDGTQEIVTGGYYNDGTRDIAQLVVWNGATLGVERTRTWFWNDDTRIYSVAVGDVDGDGQVEVVSGGYYYDGTRNRAQLCVWNGATLALEKVQTWYWTSDTVIYSVAVGDVDVDSKVEIVTGGYFDDLTRDQAQLVVWSGDTLAFEGERHWYWTGDSVIRSVAIGNVDGDGQVEIVTGGYYFSARNRAQLCIWNGVTFVLEKEIDWDWGGPTHIYSVSVSDTDSDGDVEIITGGWYNQGFVDVAQLCGWYWNGETVTLENVKWWSTMSGSTEIYSVAASNVDDDNDLEIVTGGQFNDGTRRNAQLTVWNGASWALDTTQTWFTISHTYIWSVATSNVDSDNNVEIITGGYYYDLTRYVAQLGVWA